MAPEPRLEVYTVVNDAEVIIVGAGLAGLSCGMQLAFAGREVAVVEAKPYVGGRTASWVQDGMDVESGLHRYLGFYSEVPRLLNLAGIKVNDIIIWEDEIEIVLPDGGPRGVFGLAPLFRPLQTLAGFLGNTHLLPWRDKLGLARFFALGLWAYFRDPDWLDSITTRDLALKCKLSDRVIHRILEPITQGLFFLPPSRYSAYALMGEIGPYLLRSYRLRLGGFAGGMTDVMADPIAAAIERNGGAIHRETPVEKLLVTGQGVGGVVIGGKTVRAKTVVLAADIGAAKKVLAESLPAGPWLEQVLSLPTMSALSFQADLSQRALPVDRATFGPGTRMSSFSEESATAFRGQKGRLSVILAPPADLLELSPEEIKEVVCQEARRLSLPIEDRILRYSVVPEPDTFYELSPGTEKLRPLQKTPVQGLYLAGDYTKQKYLTTMEGAVYSGRIVAQSILDKR